MEIYIIKQVVKFGNVNPKHTLSHIAGVPVEITIRALDKFTFTFDGRNDKAMSKLQAFFLGKLTGCGYDRECNMSYAYLDV